jgi:hypothetical protein
MIGTGIKWLLDLFLSGTGMQGTPGFGAPYLDQASIGATARGTGPTAAEPVSTPAAPPPGGQPLAAEARRAATTQPVAITTPDEGSAVDASTGEVASIDYPPSPDAFPPGIQLYYVYGDSVFAGKTDFTPTKPYVSQYYSYIPQLRRGEPVTVYAYVAFNRDASRNEFIINPSMLGFFFEHEFLFRSIAGASYPVVGEPQPYQVSSARAVASVLAGHPGEAAKQYGVAARQAVNSRHFWTQVALSNAPLLKSGPAVPAPADVTAAVIEATPVVPLPKPPPVGGGGATGLASVTETTVGGGAVVKAVPTPLGAPPMAKAPVTLPSIPRPVLRPTGTGAEATSPYSGYSTVPWVPKAARPPDIPMPLVFPGAKRPEGPVGDAPTDAEKWLPPPEGTPADEIKGDLPSKERIQDPSPPEGSPELRLSDEERIRSNQRGLEDLEARIGALESTEAPTDLVDDLDAIDPHSPDAARRIHQLDDRVRRWEGAHPAAAPPRIAELTGESEAARRATLGAEAERIEANKIKGSNAETSVENEILSGQPIPELGVAVKLLGSQVHVMTSTGVRIVDHLVQLPSGEIVALEVKTGKAVRSRYQLDADYALVTSGGRIVGIGAPGMAGPIKPIRTIVLRR